MSSHGSLRLPQGAERRFGRFTLLVKLGWGGMADVYLATEGGASEKPFVVKRLKPDLAFDEDYRAMFKDEARLALRLDHPNIVRAYDAGEIDGQPFLTMEFLNGLPLDSVLESAEQRKLSRGEVLHITSQLLAGLHYAHELKDEHGVGLDIVHRDVSPHNVFVTSEGRVKLVDFGIAKSRIKAQHTMTGVVKGKIAYMAPEQALANVVDKRADVFAAGVILWELLTAKPFWGDKADVQILKTMTFGELPCLDEVLPNPAPELRRILDQALSITPDKRYASAAAFRGDLDAFIGKLGEAADPAVIGASIGALAAAKRKAIEEVLDGELANNWRIAAEPERQPPLSLRERAAAPPSGKGADKGGDPFDFGDAPSPEIATTSDGQALPVGRGSSTPPRSKTSWPLGIVAALGTIAAVGLGVRGFKSSSIPPEPQPSPTVGATGAPQAQAPISALGSVQLSPSSEASPNTISVRVSTTPPEATVMLDGTRLAENPFVARFPKDGVAHRLTFDAPGYVHRAELVTFDKDVDVDVVLVAHRGFTPFTTSSAGASRPGVGSATVKSQGVDERDPWPTGKPKR